MKLLMIEDEFSFADAVCDRLRQEGYEVYLASNGEQGYEQALSPVYDAVILDVMLPGIDGFGIVRDMRKYGVTTPVLMLTARDSLHDKVTGLDYGADDYMTKSFEMDELLARIRALIRRNAGYADSSLTFGNIRLDLKQSILQRTDTEKRINISGKEAMLMEYLLLNQRQVLTKDQISEHCWGISEDVNYNHVEVYVSFLRKKLRYIGTNVVIRAVRGVGYCLMEEMGEQDG